MTLTEATHGVAIENLSLFRYVIICPAWMRIVAHVRKETRKKFAVIREAEMRHRLLLGHVRRCRHSVSLPRDKTTTRCRVSVYGRSHDNVLYTFHNANPRCQICRRGNSTHRTAAKMGQYAPLEAVPRLRGRRYSVYRWRKNRATIVPHRMARSPSILVISRETCALALFPLLQSRLVFVGPTHRAVHLMHLAHRAGPFLEFQTFSHGRPSVICV